ncbi:MAG: hypothetical protein A2287_00070 [Candidatus Melainabacteria bacterium RIFOXYA12_FULL_32_12]|nr:MAG: hypothetical protein A2255_10820 [Candidatus Melainabacteria bacterium RIFOXYA2_FULL_32_9]OGI31809.1 MAG: hypothetical protein A2287_00070 [Candidatus Melainabacteria bacterium RIFOXYA12_FULL_32_12]
MSKLPEIDKNNTIKRYSDRLKLYGYSPKTLGWVKGKQDIRFDILISQYNFENKSLLDIGCGFGDLNKNLKKNYKNYTYLGIDLNDELIQIGKELYKEEHIRFESGDFLEKNFSEQFDYIIESGIFNHKLEGISNYDFIEAVIEKSLKICNDGIAFDFLSDKVDYTDGHTFHSSPEKILSIAYKFSRNIVLRNDYMPFEFSLFLFKDDSFSKENTVFQRYNILNNRI